MHINLKPNKHKIISFNTSTTECALPLSAGGLSLQPNFQKGGWGWGDGGLRRPQLLEGHCWERGGVTFLREGGCNCHI